MSQNNDDIFKNDPSVNPLIIDCNGDMIDAFNAPDVHPNIVSSLQRYENGDLVSTSDNKVGLIVNADAYDKQGILFYTVIVDGKKCIYSALQLRNLNGAK